MRGVYSDNQEDWDVMSKKDVGEILDQVMMRYERASQLFWSGDSESADKELSELRDVLDDVYDRPEEEVKKETSDGG